VANLGHFHLPQLGSGKTHRFYAQIGPSTQIFRTLQPSSIVHFCLLAVMANPTEVNYERKEMDFEEQGEAATMTSCGGTPSTRPIDGAERGMLRKFSPAFLNALDFIQGAEGEPTGCLRALQSSRN
jgi:hypothetical protein